MRQAASVHEPNIAGTPEVLRPEPDRRHQEPVAIIRIARLWPGSERASAPTPAVAFADPVADSLDAFGSESVALQRSPWGESVPDVAPATPDVPARRDWSRAVPALKWVGVVMLSATTAGAAVWQYQRRTAVPANGSLTIQTTPAGREVLIDGRPAGLTPLTVSLAPASYSIQVGSGAERRDLALNVTAGSSVPATSRIAGGSSERVNLWLTSGPNRAPGADDHCRRSRTRTIANHDQPTFFRRA